MKKLSLKKMSIAALNDAEVSMIKGGDTDAKRTNKNCITSAPGCPNPSELTKKNCL